MEALALLRVYMSPLPKNWSVCHSNFNLDIILSPEVFLQSI
jgi:hypothetical protein